jgi:DNA-binding transcriptional ArsR family regulator
MANGTRHVSALDALRPVAELAATLPVSRPALSQHLRVLKHAGLVQDQAQGTRRLYSIDQRGIAALHAYLDRFWDHTLTNFKELAEQQREEGR